MLLAAAHIAKAAILTRVPLQAALAMITKTDLPLPCLYNIKSVLVPIVKNQSNLDISCSHLFFKFFYYYITRLVFHSAASGKANNKLPDAASFVSSRRQSC